MKISFNRVSNWAQENIEIAYGCLPGISGVIGFGKFIESLAQAGNWGIPFPTIPMFWFPGMDVDVCPNWEFEILVPCISNPNNVVLDDENWLSLEGTSRIMKC